jgi:hypothetical protein
MADSIAQGLSNLSVNGDKPTSTTQKDDMQAAIAALFERGQRMNDEMELFVSAVIEKEKVAKRFAPVEYKNIRNDMRTELATLKRLAEGSMSEDKARHYMVSSNLAYYEALWSAAKRSTGLQSFRKYYFLNGQTVPANTLTQKQVSMGSKGIQTSRVAAMVDIVAAVGAKWIRVSTVAEKTILHDIAKLGWINDSESEDEDLPARSPNDDEDDENQIQLVRTARELARVARANPVHGRPPKIHFILTRLVPGQSPVIDVVINKIRATGAFVECGDDIPPTPPFEDALPQLLLDRSRALSNTLNMDCTIMLALISDISHKACPILDWYPREVVAQINQEAEEQLLPTHLYPAIENHPMVCTEEAANQVNIIVQTLATKTEKLRADLLLGQGDQKGRPSEELIAEWTAISDHRIPPGFTLPVKVEAIDLDNIIERLPFAAKTVASELVELNRSIFLYGWANGYTTVSANRSRARHIESIINKQGLEEGEVGPHIWLCAEPRSLIAKTSRRPVSRRNF